MKSICLIAAYLICANAMAQVNNPPWGIHFRPPTGTPTLEIHTLDVANADAAIIKVNTRTRPYLIAVDAGRSGAAYAIREYLLKDEYMGIPPDSLYFDLMLISHYDKDHIGGFVGTGSHPGLMWTGGEETNDVFFPIPYYASLDPGPTHINDDDQKIVYKELWSLNRSKRIHCGQYNKAPVQMTLPAPLANPTHPVDTTMQVGSTISLGADANGVPVTLRLVAANGYTCSPTQEAPNNLFDVPGSMGISRAQGSYGDNNNWSMVWILEYGQFRYYTGGDLCGVNTTSLFDMETSVANYSKQLYPATSGPIGHVCALKVNHHGSHHSSNQYFVETMGPTVAIFSCGTGHGHPHQPVIDRFNNTWWFKNNINHFRCRLMACTELEHGRRVDGNRLLISGGKHYVVATDLPKQINGKATETLTKRARDFGYDPITLKRTKLSILEMKMIEHNQATGDNYGDAGNTLPDDLYDYDGDTDDEFEEAPVSLVQWNVNNDVKKTDGDMAIKVYPVNGDNESIRDVSSFTLTLTKSYEYQAAEPLVIKCHNAPPPPNNNNNNNAPRK